MWHKPIFGGEMTPLIQSLGCCLGEKNTTSSITSKDTVVFDLVHTVYPITLRNYDTND